MTTVRHLLGQKINEVWAVAPNATLLEALKMMSDHDIGVVVVVDQGSVAGIFSERDFAREVARNEKVSLDTAVSRLMSSQVYFIKPDQLVNDCMAIMTEKHIRHLPVMDKDRLIGVISIGDVVREMVEEKDITIRSLENYILGREQT
jgi:CBS domain-containing protein